MNDFPEGFDPRYAISMYEEPDTEANEALLQAALQMACIPFRFWTEWNGIYEFVFMDKDGFEAALKLARKVLPKDATAGSSWYTRNRDKLNA